MVARLTQEDIAGPADLNAPCVDGPLYPLQHVVRSQVELVQEQSAALLEGSHKGGVQQLEDLPPCAGILGEHHPALQVLHSYLHSQQQAPRLQ